MRELLLFVLSFLAAACSEGLEGEACDECAAGYEARGDVCVLCPSTARLWLLIVGSLLFLSAGCLLLTVLTVRAGFNRKSIHSVVIKLFVAHLAAIQTFTPALLVSVKDKPFLSSLWPFRSTSSYSWFPFQCLLFQHSSYPTRFLADVVARCLVPLLTAILTTLFGAQLFLLLQNKYTRKTAPKVRLIARLKTVGLWHIGKQLEQDLEESRILSIWRFISISLTLDPRAKIFRFIKDMIPVYFVICVVMYGSVLTTAMEPVSCVIDAFGVSRSQFVPSVICERRDARYRLFEDVSTALVTIWAIGVPLLCFSVLYRQRRRLSDASVRAVYGFLYNGYSANRWYWEIMLFVRKAFIYIPVLLSEARMDGTRPVEISLLSSVVFLLLNQRIKPFDDRNGGVLGRVESGALVTWLVSTALTLYADAAASTTIAFGIILVNWIFILIVLVVLFRELGNWARTTSLDRRLISLLAWPIKWMRRKNQLRRDRAPYLQFIEEDRKVYCRAAVRKSGLLKVRRQEIAQDCAESDRVPPALSHQLYWVTTMVKCFWYFNQRLGTNKVLWSSCEYILRQALVAAHLERTGKARSRRLGDLPESEYEQVVRDLRAQADEEERLAAERSARINKELAEYFAGRVVARDRDAKSNIEMKSISYLGDPKEIAVESLFSNKALGQRLTIEDFHQQIYLLEQQSSGNVHWNGHQKFVALSSVKESRTLVELSARLNKKLALSRALEAMLRSGRTIAVSSETLNDLQRKVSRLEASLSKIEQCSEFCSQRPRDMVAKLQQDLELGRDVLASRINPVTQENEIKATQGTEIKVTQENEMKATQETDIKAT